MRLKMEAKLVIFIIYVISISSTWSSTMFAFEDIHCFGCLKKLVIMFNERQEDFYVLFSPLRALYLYFVDLKCLLEAK